MRDLSQKLQESNAKRDKFEVELKASIDKIFVLREIISDLETQVETKALNEHVLVEKVKVSTCFVVLQIYFKQIVMKKYYAALFSKSIRFKNVCFLKLLMVLKT